MPIHGSDRTSLAATLAGWQRAYAVRDVLPESAAGPWPADTGTRGGGDVLAAWRRWHEPRPDATFSASEWPWYAVFERARVETLASRHLVGMALNLADLDGLVPTTESAALLYRLARTVFAGDAASGACPSTRVPLSSLVDALTEARTQLRDAATFAETLRTVVRELAADSVLAPTSQSLASAAAPDTMTQGEGDDPGESSNRVSSTQSPAEDIELRKTDAAYGVYSRRWDQVAPASHWREAAELPWLVDQGQAPRRMAHRLQRRLQAARLRRWSFDCDAGLLDSRRLARLLIPAADPAVFRRESDVPVPEACVVLLIDQSGSMRGAARQIAFLAVELAVRALELCRIRCEVLGYTTRFGADNPLLREWRESGTTQPPGRLNAVRHILYKSAQQPWRRARPHLGLLLAADFGRENIDGEALIWAASRLRSSPEPNKILAVLSDGIPYDAATVAANGRAYLEDHLRAAIARIEQGPIHLAAIGAGRNVGRYYRNALTVQDPGEVTQVLLAHLGDVLTRIKDPSRLHRTPH